MGYQNRHDFRQRVLDIAKSVDPSVEIDGTDFNVLVSFEQPDYLGSLGMATTLIKAISLLPGVEPRVVDPRDENSMQYAAPEGIYLSIAISGRGVDMFIGETA
jgi:hypothetical protein